MDALMSDATKETKGKKKRQKKADKRKASNSPVVEEDGHGVSAVCTIGTSSTCLASATYTQDSVHSNVHSNVNILSESDRYVQSVLDFNKLPIMSLGQHLPYGYHTPQTHLQSPPINQTPSTVFAATPPPVTSQTPAWALQLMEDMRSIKAALPKIDRIEHSVNSMDLKITAMQSKVSLLESKIKDIEKSTQFLSDDYETQKTSMKHSNDEIKKLKDMCDVMQKTVSECRQQEERATDKLLDLEARSMRENLIFYGLTEPQETGDQSALDNCEHLVKELIRTKLELDPSNMTFDRAHRLGGPRARKPRPVVVKFHRYTERETVRLKSQDPEIKTRLRGSNQGVGIQSPQQYREARKALIEDEKREKASGNRARIVGNKLIVNNKPVKKYMNGTVSDI